MKSVSEVIKLTGVSARTLQYYDKIGLLKPSKLTQAGYRLYDDRALQKLQQILFFKELGFKLKEINDFINQPDFDKIAAFKKQKELFLLKRNRTDRLIQLLSHLEKGEQCMSFKEFDLTDYINALEDFKKGSTDAIIEHWGSIENFDMFIQKIKNDESELAKLAIKQFGSIEKYTEAMKYNLEHFSEIVDKQLSEIPEEMKQDDLFVKLASNKGKEVSSDEVQSIVTEIISFAYGNAPSELLGNHENYCRIIIDAYSNDYLSTIFDTKNGSDASAYIVKAFQYYADNACEKKQIEPK